jgi:hypothetical protein
MHAYDRYCASDTVVHSLGMGVAASYPAAIGLTAAACMGALHSGDDEDVAIARRER